jgi:excisionase family DNA binding protein
MLYTPDEAAKLLKVSRTTVYRLVARNALRSVRIGSSPNAMIRIPADELDFYFRTSVAGREVHERALKILELRGTHPTDATADEYVEALREAGGAEAVYADRVGIQIAVDMHALRAAEDDGADDGAEDE